jgi:hypothetical protein
MGHNTAALALREQLVRVAQLYASRSPADTADLLLLARWQAARLRRTYADLEAQDRYAAAADFFFDDLYGPHDFAQRDADIERIYPVMVKLLPVRAVAVVASAMEVNALTAELDRTLLARLRSSGTLGDLGVARYARAYRACASREARARQIELIVHVGDELDSMVHVPFVFTTLKLLRGPAHLAGLGALQDFLERGFTAFRAMGGAEEFLSTIQTRETDIMERIFAGDDQPFEGAGSAA